LLTSFCKKTQTNCGADYGFSSSTLLLDDLNTSAAYSLRKLRTAYSGPAIRVRRSSDNAEADIGFTASGDLDTVTLLAFLRNFNFQIPPTTFNGFVTIWYDQLGNGRNATQTDPTRQPQIVRNGALITENGRVYIDFSVNKGLFISNYNASLAFTVAVLKSDASAFSNYHTIFDGAGGQRRGGILEINQTYFHNFVYPPAVWRNGTALAVPFSLSPITTPFQVSIQNTGFLASNACIGNFENGPIGGAAKQSETIVFSSIPSTTERQTIEINQAQYYGIGGCGADYDFRFFSSQGMPGFQGNCFLVTNEQIRWLQLNGVIPNISTAPDNKSCPTKSQFEGYIGGFGLNGSAEYTALANNNCIPIGYWYPQSN
jgi:hypothetical protein